MDFNTEIQILVFVYRLNHWCLDGSFSFVVSLYKPVNISRPRSAQCPVTLAFMSEI